MNAIVLNGISYALDNPTDYYISEWIYREDWPFRITTRAKSLRWRRIMDKYEFNKYNASYVDAIYLPDLGGYSWSLWFVAGDYPYTLHCDYREKYMFVERHNPIEFI